MTLYLSFRSATVGGVVTDPRIWESDAAAPSAGFRLVGADELIRRAAGKDVLFGVHGFNVDFAAGVTSLGRLDALLLLRSGAPPASPGAVMPKASDADEIFIAVLWPGDSWVPVINYPFEGSTAIKCGRKLAGFCNANLRGARSLSFASHSLGARLVLEAVKGLTRQARALCLTAGAVNDNCLTGQYGAARANSVTTWTLASRRDRVLQVAYPLGDLIAVVLHDDHAFGEPALGRAGPKPLRGGPTTLAELKILPSQIPDDQDYDHGDYFPSSKPVVPAGFTRPLNVVEFIRRMFRNEREVWP